MRRGGTSEGWVELPTGTRVYHRIAGRGDPVVLIHGIAHSSRAWSRVMGPLAERYQVVALDLPGCGRSDKRETDYSIGAQAAAVRYVLDALDLDLVTAVGHSLGGGIAMALAYGYPERVGRLGLIATGGLGRDLHPLFRFATLPVLPERAMGVLFRPGVREVRDAMGRLMSLLAGDPFFADPGPHREHFRELLEGLEEPGAQHAFLATLRSVSNVSGQAISALDRIGSARMPMLLVWGREDRVFPVAHALRAAEALPRARIEIIERCGHFPQLESTERFTSILLGWLAETRPRRVRPRAA